MSVNKVSDLIFKRKTWLEVGIEMEERKFDDYEDWEKKMVEE